MIQVRKYTYRDVPGWRVSGTPPNGRCHRISIFFERECAARAHAAKERSGRGDEPIVWECVCGECDQ